MTVENELAILSNTKTELGAAIEGKGRDLTNKNLSEYAAEIMAIDTSCSNKALPDMEANWTPSAKAVNGLLVADKQAPYDRVDPEQPGMVEAGDGTAIYRDTGVIPPVAGFIETFIYYDGIGNQQSLFGAIGAPEQFILFFDTTGKLIFRNRQFSNDSDLVITNIPAGYYRIRVEWTASSKRLVFMNFDSSIITDINDTATGYNGTGTIYIHAYNSVSYTTGFYSNQKIAYININDEHYYSAPNMYYDQIGNSNAVAYGGTPIVTADALGDQSMNERGYSTNGGYAAKFLTTAHNYIVDSGNNPDGRTMAGTKISMQFARTKAFATSYSYLLAVGGIYTTTSSFGYISVYVNATLLNVNIARDNNSPITVSFIISLDAINNLEIEYNTSECVITLNGYRKTISINGYPTIFDNYSFRFGNVAANDSSGGKNAIKYLSIEYSNWDTFEYISTDSDITASNPNSVLSIVGNPLSYQTFLGAVTIPASLTDPTKDASGNSLEHAGRNAHSVELDGYVIDVSQATTIPATPAMTLDQNSTEIIVNCKLVHATTSSAVYLCGQFTFQTKGFRIWQNIIDEIQFQAHTGGAITVIKTPSITMGWHELKFTINGLSVQIFIDGILRASGAAPNGWALFNNQPFYIGSRNQSADFKFNGLISNVQISSSTFSAHYDASNITQDISGNGNHLAVSGDAKQSFDILGSKWIYEGYRYDNLRNQNVYIESNPDGLTQILGNNRYRIYSTGAYTGIALATEQDTTKLYDYLIYVESITGGIVFGNLGQVINTTGWHRGSNIAINSPSLVFKRGGGITDAVFKVYIIRRSDGVFPLLADKSACTDGSQPDPNPNIIEDLNPAFSSTDDGRLDQYLTGSGLENGGEVTYANITETSNVIKFGTSSFSVWNSNQTINTVLNNLCNGV